MPRSAVVLLFVLLLGCSASTRAVVRLDTGQGEPIVHTPRRDVEPVAVNEKEFKKAIMRHAPTVPPVERPLEHARQLFGVPERSGWYRYEGESRPLLASEPGSIRNLRLLPEDEDLKRRYLLWCEQGWGGGDCLRLLVDKPLAIGRRGGRTVDMKLMGQIRRLIEELAAGRYAEIAADGRAGRLTEADLR